MHSEPQPESNPALHGITAESLLAAQSLPAWVCAAASMEILAANGAGAWHLGGVHEALPGRVLTDERLAPTPAHALTAWAAAGPGREQLWPLQRIDGSLLETRVVVTPLIGDGPERLLVVALPALLEREGGARGEEEMLRAAKRESLELLAGGVAHDFNNLLTALLGNLSLARMDTAVSDTVQDWLEEAEKAAGRARDLTHQLLTFAKGGEPVRRLVNLGDYLREAAQFARQGSRVRCECTLPAELWPAEVDAGQVGQVVHNLVLNAVQAMSAGGVVTVGARNVTRDMARQLGLGSGHFVVVTVTDEGPGIRPEDMARIFQPYFTTKSQGSGLGLATSQAIARRHYGALRVESPPGQGATFLLYLPAKPGARVEQEAGGAVVPTLAGRVLFMDDEPSIRQLAPNLLRRLGFEAEVVADGLEAIEAYVRAAAEGRRFDVVILDLTVPAGMGGSEAMQRLRAIDPAVQVIVSSGYAADPVLLEHRAHGFCGVVNKPYSLSVLASVLNRVLEGDATPA
ncbi:MAG: response regulator [Opitutaceae bacterium]|nr:response regulator [Opitutaceae bacterium]